MRFLQQKSFIAFMAAAGFCSFVSAEGAPAPKEPETPVKGLSSLGTILVKGNDAVVDENGIARFNVRMTTSLMAAYPTSSSLAVVFDDAMLDKDSVECPVINISGRPRKIEELKRNILTVEASVTPEEKERVLRAHCVVVTPTPAIKEFKFLPRENSQNAYQP